MTKWVGPQAYRLGLEKYEKEWQDGDLPHVVSAIADFCSLDPKALDWHVEAVHGWEPHDSYYATAVWQAASCLLGIQLCDLL
jgi:hypothetical protein